MHGMAVPDSRQLIVITHLLQTFYQIPPAQQGNDKMPHNLKYRCDISQKFLRGIIRPVKSNDFLFHHQWAHHKRTYILRI